MQDLFLNETANHAHVFLPGSTFLEKDGTFINAERRIGMVRKVTAPKNGFADWEITIAIAKAMGVEWNYAHPSGGDGLQPAVFAAVRSLKADIKS